jgi:TolA-binding protein
MKHARFLIFAIAVLAFGSTPIRAEKGPCQAGSMKERVACLNKQLDKLESQIEENKKRGSKNDAVEELRSTIGKLEAKLEEVEDTVSRIEDFEAKIEAIEDLESRMGLLESKLEGIGALPSLEEAPEPAGEPGPAAEPGSAAEPGPLAPEGPPQAASEAPIPQEAAPYSQQPLTKAECEKASWRWNENANVCD